MDLTEAKRHTSWWGDDDLRALAGVATRIGANPADLLLVLYCESGLRPDAAAHNSQGFPVAVGLNQITPVAARAMGISEAERLSIIGRPIREQLAYVERYFATLPWGRSGRGYPSATILYQANAAPGTLGRGADPGVVLYRQGDGMYEGNAALDVGHKGTVTVGDLSRVLERHAKHSIYQAALLRLRSVLGASVAPSVGSTWTSPAALPALGPVLLGSVAVAFVGVVLTRGRA